MPVEKNAFPITGLSCASCAVSAESMVKAMPGVADVSVNFASASMQVVYDPAAVTPEAMHEVLSGVGYGLVLAAQQEAGQISDELKAQQLLAIRNRVFWSAVISAPWWLLQ